MKLYEAKSILQEYEYGKPFKIETPSITSKVVDIIGDKIRSKTSQIISNNLKKPKIQKSLVSGFTKLVTTGNKLDSVKAFVNTYNKEK